jgi:hypothetical protein
MSSTIYRFLNMASYAFPRFLTFTPHTKTDHGSDKAQDKSGCSQPPCIGRLYVELLMDPEKQIETNPDHQRDCGADRE